MSGSHKEYILNKNRGKIGTDNRGKAMGILLPPLQWPEYPTTHLTKPGLELVCESPGGKRSRYL